MPIGKVKWYDTEKGFGFASNPGDDDVFIGKSVLPDGVDELVAGQRIEFDFAAGRRGPQALRVKVLDEQVLAQRTTFEERRHLDKCGCIDRPFTRRAARLLRRISQHLDRDDGSIHLGLFLGQASPRPMFQ